MLVNPNNLSLHRFWIAVFVVGAVAAICGLYNFEEGAIRLPGGSSLPGLACGVVAGLLFVFECLLWPRKRLLRRWRLGRLRSWMCAHIWLGLLTLPLVLVHAGVAWRGTLATTLMIVYALVMASGAFGLLMQQVLPRWMLNTVPDETIYSQIEVVAAQNLAEADALVAATCGAPDSSISHGADAAAAAGSRAVVCETGFKPVVRGTGFKPVVLVGSLRSTAIFQGAAWLADLPPEPIANTEVLQRVYQTTIRPHLVHARGRTMLRDERQARVFFADVRSRTAPAAGPTIDRLEQWCDQRRQFARQARLHFWLHSWLAIHLPLSIALLVLLAWHAIVALKYSGIYSFT